MAKENDHITEELAKIAANFSQAKSEPKSEIDSITQELNAIANQFTQKLQPIFPTISGNHATLSNEEVILNSLDKLLKSISFVEIIKDFSSREYPDCIKDIYGEKTCFISYQKLVNNWEEIKTKKELTQVAIQWAILIKKGFSEQLSNPNLTKLKLFEELNLPMLSDQKLIDSNNLGLIINKKGEKIEQTNTDQLLIISNINYEVIRVLMVEIIWQSISKLSTKFYTVKRLKQRFDSFKAAKEHFNVSAQSWQKLADKLNEVT